MKKPKKNINQGHKLDKRIGLILMLKNHILKKRNLMKKNVVN